MPLPSFKEYPLPFVSGTLTLCLCFPPTLHCPGGKVRLKVVSQQEEDNTGFPEARLESPKHNEVEGAHAHTLV